MNRCMQPPQRTRQLHIVGKTIRICFIWRTSSYVLRKYVSRFSTRLWQIFLARGYIKRKVPVPVLGKIDFMLTVVPVLPVVGEKCIYITVLHIRLWTSKPFIACQVVASTIVRNRRYRHFDYGCWHVAYKYLGQTELPVTSISFDRSIGNTSLRITNKSLQSWFICKSVDDGSNFKSRQY